MPGGVGPTRTNSDQRGDISVQGGDPGDLSPNEPCEQTGEKPCSDRLQRKLANLRERLAAKNHFEKQTDDLLQYLSVQHNMCFLLLKNYQIPTGIVR